MKYDMKKRMRYLKQMYIKTIPEEYTHDAIKRYKTEYDRYEAIYNEISKCSEREINNLEIILKCDKASLESCLAVRGIVPIFLTAALTMVALLNPFIEKILSLPNVDYVTELLSFVTDLLMIIGSLAIILYVVSTFAFNYFMCRSIYFLEILEKVKCNKGDSFIEKSLEQGN